MEKLHSMQECVYQTTVEGWSLLGVGEGGCLNESMVAYSTYKERREHSDLDCS